MTQTNTEQLFEYWKSKTRGFEIPDRLDVLPSEVVPVLPRLFILEVSESGQICFRLVGTGMESVHAKPLNGTPFRNLFAFTDLNDVDRCLSRVVTDNIVTIIRTQAKGQRGYPEFETLLLPLSNLGKTNRIIGCQSLVDSKDWLPWMGRDPIYRHSVLTIAERTWFKGSVIKDPRLQPPKYEVPVFVDLSRRGRPPQDGRKVGHLTVIEGGAGA